MPAPHYDKKLSRSSRGKRFKWILLLSVAPRNAHADINGDSCDFVLRRARDILIGLPFIIARVIVSVITVISIFVPDVFKFDASSFQMLICPKHRDDFGIGWRCRQKLCKEERNQRE